MLRGNLNLKKTSGVHWNLHSVLQAEPDSTVLTSENRRQYLPCLSLNTVVECTIRMSSVNLARHFHGEHGMLMVVIFRYSTFKFCHSDLSEH